MTDRSETTIQTIKRVRASVRRTQVKADQAAKGAKIMRPIADAFSAASLERSRESQDATPETRHQPSNGAKDK